MKSNAKKGLKIFKLIDGDNKGEVINFINENHCYQIDFVQANFGFACFIIYKIEGKDDSQG